jgi:hypothetical protein
MQKIIFLLGFLIVSNHLAKAQLLYPIVGSYKGKSAQDMAIYGDKAYLMGDGGHCRVLNLKTGEIERELDLASSGKNTHINGVSFGKYIPNGSDVPLLYVSETIKPHRCFVENVNGDKSILEQTIEAVENGNTYANFNWVVDREQGFLYGLKSFWHQFVDELGNIKTIVTKYRLPQISEGKKVVLSEEDKIDRFEVFFTSSMQGTAIYKGKLYFATGLWESDQNTSETHRIVVVVDLKKKKVVKQIDVNRLTTNEPEGIDFYRNKCLLFCGQTGGIYKVK